MIKFLKVALIAGGLALGGGAATAPIAATEVQAQEFRFGVRVGPNRPHYRQQHRHYRPHYRAHRPHYRPHYRPYHQRYGRVHCYWHRHYGRVCR